MKKVALKKAVASGAWYECEGEHIGKFRFRIRFVGFRRASSEEIDAWLRDDETLEGVPWILSIEVVNLGKTSMRGLDVREIARLIDEDGYEFEASGLTNSDALERFSNWGGAVSPKLVTKGAVAFELPDEETDWGGPNSWRRNRRWGLGFAERLPRRLGSPAPLQPRPFETKT